MSPVTIGSPMLTHARKPPSTSVAGTPIEFGVSAASEDV
jgi:hypothetical protein